MVRLRAWSGLAFASVSLPLSLMLLATPAQARDEPAWFWEWSDGSTAQARSLQESRYAVWSRLPTITVASAPPASGRSVRLQIRQPGGWATEDTARTDSEGRAELTINPYCRNGDWCTGTMDYRIITDTDQASLRVTFTPRQASP